MKIALFTPYNIFKGGGVQEHVQHQASILRQRGYEVDIITPKPRTHNEKTPKGVLFLGNSARIRAPHATSADVSISIDNEAIDEVLANDYDIIHVHEPLVPIAGRQILSRAEGLRATRIGTFHAALPGNRLGKSLVATYKSYARAVLPHVDVITAVSPAAVGYITEYTDKQIHYISNGYNSEIYKVRNNKRDPNLVLFIGRLEKRKGARQAIKAFVELKKMKPEAILKIAGDGPMKRSLMQYVEDYEIDGVEFLGYIDDNTKLDLLSRCSIYTSPALYGESFGIVLAEAMAMNAPIVAHPNDGYRWVMSDTGRISLVDCKDPQAYAERMLLMMEDEAIRKVWQKWAQKYVKQFDYKNVVDEYEKLYKTNFNRIDT